MKPNRTMKIAAVASSLALATTYVLFQAGAFARYARPSPQRIQLASCLRSIGTPIMLNSAATRPTISPPTTQPNQPTPP